MTRTEAVIRRSVNVLTQVRDSGTLKATIFLAVAITCVFGRLLIPLPIMAVPFPTFSVGVIVVAFFCGTAYAAGLWGLGLLIVVLIHQQTGDPWTGTEFVRMIFFSITAWMNMSVTALMWGALKGERDKIHELSHRDRQVFILAQELSHRIKNQFAIVNAMVRQTTAKDIEEYKRLLTERILGLSRAQDIIVANEFADLSLAELVKVFTRGHKQVKVIGDHKVRLRPIAVQYLAMALQELITNAIKYGALKVANGEITISYEIKFINRRPMLYFTWQEKPATIRLKNKSGFGTQVLENYTPIALGGSAAFGLKDDGLEWNLWVPLNQYVYADVCPSKESCVCRKFDSPCQCEKVKLSALPPLGRPAIATAKAS